MQMGISYRLVVEGIVYGIVVVILYSGIWYSIWYMVVHRPIPSLPLLCTHCGVTLHHSALHYTTSQGLYHTLPHSHPSPRSLPGSILWAAQWTPAPSGQKDGSSNNIIIACPRATFLLHDTLSTAIYHHHIPLQQDLLPSSLPAIIIQLLFEHLLLSLSLPLSPSPILTMASTSNPSPSSSSSSSSSSSDPDLAQVRRVNNPSSISHTVIPFPPRRHAGNRCLLAFVGVLLVAVCPGHGHDPAG